MPPNPAPKKWTKKDVASIKLAIDSFVLFNRMYRPRVALQAHLRDNRKEIVLKHFRGLCALHADRYRHNCETIGNQLVRFTKYGEPDELIERFTRLAREEDESAKKANEIVLRIVAEGLPPEVATYMPPDSVFLGGTRA